MLISPFSILKFAGLKATIAFLFILLVKSNLLRLKGGIIGGLVALGLISGLILSSSIALGSIAYIFKLKKDLNEFSNNSLDDQLEPVEI